MGFAAPATAPAAKPVADLLFTLSASQATFRAADRLVLEGLQATAQVFNTETSAAAAYPLGAPACSFVLPCHNETCQQAS